MNSYFFSGLNSSIENSVFIENIKEYANQQKIQVYLLSSPLIENKYTYDCKGAYLILTPKRKIIFVNVDATEDSFENFVDDVKEDLASISDKYGFKDFLGRKRTWDKYFMEIKEPSKKNFAEIYSEKSVLERTEYRKIDVLISLFIGSVNDVIRIGVDDPKDLLETVKSKIQLFDSDQTRFIYDEIPKKIIKIQGLSGTGKTELLLHKMKDLYLKNNDTKICFTCHNKVLADNLLKRIPFFFDFMKVDKQIAWNERLWCFNAWGGYGRRNSGFLSYVCDFYNVPFWSLKEAGTFSNACKRVIRDIKEKTSENINFAFDYVFVDEFQDFDESFIELCDIVTKSKIILAGDIFQNIFERKDAKEINADYVLSRCYRTDPKTFMFAHGLGMGFFENEKLWWLKEDALKLCGYDVSVLNNGGIYELSRAPIKRFEDLSSDFKSLIIEESNDIYGSVVSKIKELKNEFVNLQPSDIGIVFIDNDDYIYEDCHKLGTRIFSEIGWDFNLAHVTKKCEPDTVFISNRNNVKGLEFSFVFCLTKVISRFHSYRNTLYTMLTRSFLRSYLIVENNNNNGLCHEILEGAKNIMKEKKMTVFVPSEDEQQRILCQFNIEEERLSLSERMNSIMERKSIPYESRKTIVGLIASNLKSDTIDDDLESLIDMFYKTMK